ncbi:hypothetical protein H9P43_003265 [Blastocladiella emersonii ATCC 22665]|nr:hypothetical protein H9P43_003265 [Blastocladiella emersonii ATCC 22665]
MSDRLLKQQLAASLKKSSGSSAPRSSAAAATRAVGPDRPSMKIPVVRRGIGKVKERIRTHHRQDRAAQGLAGGASKARGFLDSRTKEWVAVGDEGLLGTYTRDTEEEQRLRREQNESYFALNSLADARTLTKRSKLHAYKAKETKAKAEVLAAIADAQKDKKMYRDTKRKKVVAVTPSGKRRLKFVDAGVKHNPEDDEDDF